MSAITGIFHFNDEPISIEHGRGLMKTLQKYPADDIQTWHKDNIFLGCHAQWITPESIGEQLPYYDYERQLAITADAIIDNRDELFERLQVDCADRKSMTDSELILLSYHKWGEDVPKYLVGDFAFMIWDEKKQMLFGARDFSGSRTLYYYRDDWRFAFCTVIMPLFTLPYIKKELNEEWLAEFLAIPLNFESVELTSSVYKNIEQIPPSHSIKVKDGRVSFFRYCLLKEREKLRLSSNEEYEEAFRNVFQRAVTDRLRTHHQVGAHLSGGLDSGSVASFAAKALRNEKKELHSFSYVPVKGFEDWTHKSEVPDERPFIQSTVDYVGNIKPNYLDFKEKSSLTEVDDWLDALEMPYKYYENSYWLKGIYEEASKQGIRVLLNGQRGNWTISWGHALDYQALLLKRLKLIRLFLEIHYFGQRLGVKKSRIISVVLKKAFPSLKKPSDDDYSYPMLVNPGFAEKVNVFNKLQEHNIELTGSVLPNAFEMKKTQFEQLYYWGINGTYATKLSLRHAIWERDPTNDLRVIQFCLSVPEEQFVQFGQDRSLIRRSTKNYLPENVRLNQKTRGLQGADGIKRMLPSWNIFVEEVQQLCKDEMAAEFLNIKVIKKSLENIKDHPEPNDVFKADFRILMRSVIFYRFIKKYA
ncbi:asparagine synthase (glutamine-hydrolyzing) [Bacillus fengqiuensis]|nr:asparagine synthase (glutamine-hydrolyzing) [Bacillus fengqiuensis]